MPWFQLVVILVLILLNGFFNMAELAVVSARRMRLQTAADSGRVGARVALALKGDLGRFLSTVQIGITVIGVLAGVFGGATLADDLAHAIADEPGWAGVHAHALSVALVTAAIAFVTLIFGELTPKRIALRRPEVMAAHVAALMATLARIAAPLEWFLSRTSDLVLKALPLRPAEPMAATEQEIAYLLREAAAAGHLEQAEHAIVQMALRLGDRLVGAVMTPRTEVEGLDLGDPAAENRRRIVKSDFSRFPVFEGEPHHLVGVVQVKDLLTQLLSGRPFDLRAVMKAPLFLPENSTALHALELFRRSGTAMLFIVDEYGDFQGIVTLHDILQALVGDIVIRGEKPAPPIVRRDDGSLEVEGLVGVDEVRDLVPLPVSAGEKKGAYHTVGGLVMSRLNRVPQVGDKVRVGGFRLEVLAMDGRRVDRVLIVPPAKAKSRQGAAG
ncbi:MAG: HlyC/CorC family transporter [Alphaproteobacteria bacterium]|nr:HlyC/CorC family transporter [Alphaproteobacteria bacterium]